MMAPTPPLYRERAPIPQLAPWVECTWGIEGWLGPGVEVTRNVLPDGCMDVIFDLESQSDAHFVVGTMTRALPVSTRGTVNLLGVRFRPGAARAFLDLSAHEVLDARGPLEAFWGASACETWERLKESDEAVLDEVLLRRLTRSRDDEVVRCAASLIDSGVQPGSKTLARHIGLGLRQLERRFREAVGVSPGTLARILRFRRATSLIARGSGANLARVALEAGYHDQPHMNRDFQQFAGVSPGVYRTGRGDPA